jgi:hypothetical protein
MINLSIDFGGSGIKAIANMDDQLYGFRIAPEVIEIIGDPPVLNTAFAVDLTKNMWVGSGGHRTAVGLLARTGYLASIPLVAPKANYVVPRTMAAVAATMAKFGVTRDEVNLQLLLPSAEFGRTDFAGLLNKLKAALLCFDSPTGKLRAKLKNCSVHPEGWGLMKRFLTINPQHRPDQMACIMFGYRNTTLYVYSGGEPKHYYSNDEGFARAIEYAKLDSLEGLRDPSLVDQASIDKYWLANKNWLIENLPSGVAIAVVGGGPIATIENRVSEFLEPRGAVSFYGGIPLDLGHLGWSGKLADYQNSHNLLKFWPKAIEFTESDRRQFADVYCLWATNEMTKMAGILV